MSIKFVVGKKYRQVRGDTLTLLSDKATGTEPLVFQYPGGSLTKRAADGRCPTWPEGDIVSEYVEPRKVIEAWVRFTSEGMGPWAYSCKKDAQWVEKECGGTIHHLREVNEAREKAVEALVKAVRRWLDVGYGPLADNVAAMRMALAALDASEGVK